MICPDLSPIWTRGISTDEELKQWEIIKKYLLCEDSYDLHVRLFFGDTDTNTPVGVGYTIGYNIVQAFLKTNLHITFKDLMDMDTQELLKESEYMGMRLY